MKTLAKEHGLFSATNTGTPSEKVFTLSSFTQGWRILNPAGIFASDTYFDLAGLAQREKTLFFEGATVQDMFNPVLFGGQPGDSIVLVDLMSTKPLNDTELASFFLYGNFANFNAVLTFDQTVYARINQYVVDLDTAAWGSMVQVSSNQIGSLNATASDRIYSYRIIATGTPFNGTQLDLPACRHLLRAEAKEEADYQYLMRLRRSYELQQSYDED
jgi:hypothetical protein